MCFGRCESPTVTARTGALRASPTDLDFLLVGSVTQCTDLLPKDRPVYSMGIGMAEDLLVVLALGVDMVRSFIPPPLHFLPLSSSRA